MDPVFDQSGKVVAWLRGDFVLDPKGRHVAILRNNWVITYRGVFCGRFYRNWFRDVTGAAVGFMRRPTGQPTPPATEPPPPPPLLTSAPVPPLFGIPPMAVRPMPVWSKIGWDVFVGIAVEEPPPGEPAPPTVAEVDLTMTPRERDVATTPSERPSSRRRRAFMPVVEEVMTIVRTMSSEELDEFFRRLTEFDQTEWEKERSEATGAFHAQGSTDSGVGKVDRKLR